MTRLGVISFQSNDRADVFAVQEVWENGVEPNDEMFLSINETLFDADKAWVTGRVPQIKTVDVDGDTAIVQAYFKGELFSQQFYMTLYVECELAEEVQDTQGEAREEAARRERQVEVYM